MFLLCFRALWPSPENVLFKFGPDLVPKFSPLVPVFRNRGNGGNGYEALVYARCLLVRRDAFENLELFGFEVLDRRFVNERGRVLIFEKPVEPRKGMDAKILSVLVGTLGDMEPEVALRPKEAVQLFRLRMDLDHSVEWEDPVLVGLGKEKGPWSHQARDHGKVPTVGIHLIHAVAMSLHAPVDDVVAHACDSRHGHGRLDPLVESRYPPTVGPAPGTPRHPDSFGIHLGSALQVVKAAYAIPCFHPGGRMPGHPPPHVLGISPDEYPRSHRVGWCRWSASVSVPGNQTVVMVMNLVAM